MGMAWRVMAGVESAAIQLIAALAAAVCILVSYHYFHIVLASPSPQRQIISFWPFQIYRNLVKYALAGAPHVIIVGWWTGNGPTGDPVESQKCTEVCTIFSYQAEGYVKQF